MAINQKTPRKKKVGNQYTIDPRQSLFLANYLNPLSPTFSNLTRSGLAAGYTKKYSENLTAFAPDWLGVKLEELHSDQMLRKAERNLDEILDLPSMTQVVTPFGPLFEQIPTGKKKIVRGKEVEIMKKGPPVMAYASTLLKIKTDTSQFIAERLGKRKYGSRGDTNVNLQVNVFSPDQVTRVAARVLNGDTESAGAPDRLPNSD
jgi:hypothetical protein